MPAPAARILALHLPDFSVHRARAAAAAPPQAPLVLTRPVGSALRIAHACPRARQAGVRPGVTLGQALAMAHGLIALPADDAADAAVLETFADAALCFTPQVAAQHPDTLLLDITGCQPLLGPEQDIATRALAWLAEHQYAARAGLADTLGAAWALAHAGAEPLHIAPPGQTSAALAPLPPDALRIEPATAAELHAVGVRTIGDLLMLPRASLPARFGAQLVLRLQQALGETPEIVPARLPACPPAVRQDFDPPLSQPEFLPLVGARLTDELFSELAARGLALRRLTIELQRERRDPLRVQITLARPGREPRHTRRLVEERLAAVDPRGGLTALALRADETCIWRPAQAELFDERPGGPADELPELVDRLAARLGQMAVLRPELLDDYQPEAAFRLRPVADVGLESRLGVAPAPAGPRPARLLARAVAIHVEPAGADGPPARVHWNGRALRVVYAAGPERIETGWWRGPDVRRDYYRLKLESGEQLWVYRALQTQAWYLHGVFA